MQNVFCHSLSTPHSGTTHCQMLEETDKEGNNHVFLQKMLDDDRVLHVRIQLSDATDILEAMTKVNQVMTKAVQLGEVVC